MATTTAPTGFGRPIWNAIKGGNRVHGVGLVPIVINHFGDADTVSRSCFVAPAVSAGGMWKLESALVIPSVTIAAHAANYWTFMLQVGSDDMGGTGLTSISGMTEDTSYALDVDGPEAATPKKVFLAEGDILKLTMTKNDSGVDQSDTEFLVQLLFRVSPPGR